MILADVRSTLTRHDVALALALLLVRHALLQAGEKSRTLADYAASIVLHFGLRDRAQRIHAADDQTYDTLAALLEDAERSHPRRAFLVRAHLGNYALWMSGMFPDRIVERQDRRGGPTLEYFETMGRRGFQMAAERFPLLRVTLNRISDALLFPNHHTPERLMRQVHDDARWQRAG